MVSIMTAVSETVDVDTSSDGKKDVKVICATGVEVSTAPTTRLASLPLEATTAEIDGSPNYTITAAKPEKAKISLVSKSSEASLQSRIEQPRQELLAENCNKLQSSMKPSHLLGLESASVVLSSHVIPSIAAEKASNRNAESEFRAPAFSDSVQASHSTISVSPHAVRSSDVTGVVGDMPAKDLSSNDCMEDFIHSPEVQNAIVERSPGGRYVRFMEKLGSGASKDVYRAYDTQEGIEVAWNVVNLAGVPKNERNRIVNEVRLLERLHHHNIISFHGSWVNRERQEVNFVTEILSSGTLKSFIKKVQVIRWKIAKRWAVQILNGLEYLHSQDPPVIHRDLKCENIFINGTSGDLRIGDLGLSTVHRNGRVLSVLGTPEFMAPDMYEESSYDEKVDVYAFGLCMLEIFTKEIPYSECKNPAQIYKKVSSGEPPEVLSRLRSKHARDFVVLCLGYKSEEGKYVRPSVSELLQHPFLVKRSNDDDEVMVDPPLRERTISETSAESYNAANVSHASKLPPSTNVTQTTDAHVESVVTKSGPSTHSFDDTDSDRFEEMQESEINMRKVTVLMGRGQALEEEEELITPMQPLVDNAVQRSVTPNIVSGVVNIPSYQLTDHPRCQSTPPLSQQQSDANVMLQASQPVSHQMQQYSLSDSTIVQHSGVLKMHQQPANSQTMEPPLSSQQQFSRDSLPVSTQQPSGSSLHYLVAAAVIEHENPNVRPYADDILKLVVTLPVDGQTQHVQFDFHLVEDEPVQVAKEMVQELGIPPAAVLEISETISGLARNARMRQEKHAVKLQQSSQGQAHLKYVQQRAHPTLHIPMPIQSNLAHVSTPEVGQYQNLGVPSTLHQVQHTVGLVNGGLQDRAEHTQQNSLQQVQRVHLGVSNLCGPEQFLQSKASGHDQHIPLTTQQKAQQQQDTIQSESSQDNLNYIPLVVPQRRQGTNHNQAQYQQLPQDQAHLQHPALLHVSHPVQQGLSNIVNASGASTEKHHFQAPLCIAHAHRSSAETDFAAKTGQLTMIDFSDKVQSQALPQDQVYSQASYPFPTLVAEASASTYQKIHTQPLSVHAGGNEQLYSLPLGIPYGQTSLASEQVSDQVSAPNQTSQSVDSSNDKLVVPQPHGVGYGHSGPLVEVSVSNSPMHIPSTLASIQQQKQYVAPSPSARPAALPDDEDESAQSMSFPSRQQSSFTVSSSGYLSSSQEVARLPESSSILQNSVSTNAHVLPQTQTFQTALLEQHNHIPGQSFSQAPRNGDTENGMMECPEDSALNVEYLLSENPKHEAKNDVDGDSPVTTKSPLSNESITPTPDGGDSDDDDALDEEMRKLEEEFQRNLQRAKKVFINRMDNLQRSQVEREAQHQKNLERHQKERADYEKRLAQEEEQQNRRIEQLQREWEKKRETVAQSKKKNVSSKGTNGVFPNNQDQLSFGEKASEVTSSISLNNVVKTHSASLPSNDSRDASGERR